MNFDSGEVRRRAQNEIREAAENKLFQFDLKTANHFGEAQNRSCGDEMKVKVEITQDRITNLSAEIRGCLVTKAAWTLIAERMQGLPKAEVRNYLNKYLTRMNAPPTQTEDAKRELNARRGSPLDVPSRLEIPPPLTAFARPSPRRDCALLAAQALLDAIQI